MVYHNSLYDIIIMCVIMCVGVVGVSAAHNCHITQQTALILFSMENGLSIGWKLFITIIFTLFSALQ